MTKKGKVYLLSITSDDTYYKIGFTTSSTAKRVKQLQTGNSETINIVAEFETVHYLKLEKSLHRLYAPSHVRGEWFYITKEEADNFISTCESNNETIDYLYKSGNPFFT